MKATEEASFDSERDGPVDSPSERRLSSCTSLHVKLLSAGEHDAFAPVGLILGICFWFFAIVLILKPNGCRSYCHIPGVTGHDSFEPEHDPPQHVDIFTPPDLLAPG